MDDFNTIRLRRKTLQEFKEYSLKTSPNYSETLEYMIAFFEDTGISPYDTIRNPALASMVAIHRRLDYTIALLKNIEQTQLIPTREMLERLFKGIEKPEPIYIERSQEEIEASKTADEKLLESYSQELYEKNNEIRDVKQELKFLLRKASFVNNTFGKSYCRLDISKEQFEKIKSKFL